MPQIILFLTLMVVRTLYEESTLKLSFLTQWKNLWRIIEVAFTFNMMENVIFGAQIWVLGKGHWLYSIFCLLNIGNRSIYVVHMGWEITLPLEIYCNLKLGSKLWFFCSTLWYQFLDLWKPTLLSHTYYTYTKFLTSNGNEFVYLTFDWCVVPIWFGEDQKTKHCKHTCTKEIRACLQIPLTTQLWTRSGEPMYGRHAHFH